MESSTANSFRLCFLYKKSMLFMEPAQIIRLEAKSNYTCVYFTDHPPVLMAKVLKAYDTKLKPFGFIRTHSSHLVNPRYIEAVSDEGVIRMTDDSSALISRRKKSWVFKAIWHLPRSVS